MEQEGKERKKAQGIANQNRFLKKNKTKSKGNEKFLYRCFENFQYWTVLVWQDPKKKKKRVGKSMKKDHVKTKLRKDIVNKRPSRKVSKIHIPLLLTQSAFKLGREDWSLCSSIVSGSIRLIILEDRLRLPWLAPGFSETETEDIFPALFVLVLVGSLCEIGVDCVEGNVLKRGKR